MSWSFPPQFHELVFPLQFHELVLSTPLPWVGIFHQILWFVQSAPNLRTVPFHPQLQRLVHYSISLWDGLFHHFPVSWSFLLQSLSWSCAHTPVVTRSVPFLPFCWNESSFQPGLLCFDPNLPSYCSCGLGPRSSWLLTISAWYIDRLVCDMGIVTPWMCGICINVNMQ